MTDPQHLDPVEVADRLHEAIRTLSALPDRERKFLRARLTQWPSLAPTASELFAMLVARGGDSEPVRVRPAAPSPEAIDRMLPTLSWLAWLDRSARQVVLARAHRISWWKLAARFGVSERSVQRWHAEAMTRIAHKLALEAKAA